LRASRYALQSWKRWLAGDTGDTDDVGRVDEVERRPGPDGVGRGVGVTADSPGWPGLPAPPERNAVAVGLGRRDDVDAA
jgi:hypothetical protein